MKVAVIGAGPAGLVTCKTLVQAATPQFPFDPVILEQEDDIGGTFRYRSYQLTSFSDFRLPLDHTDHLTLEEYVDYLRAYAKHFDVYDRIQLGCKVLNISRHPEGGHLVTFLWQSSITSGLSNLVPETLHVAYVAICTGLHVSPAVPDIPGIEHVLNNHEGDSKPAVFHSAQYKSRSQLAGRRVMILGTGETGMDLAYESAKAGAKEVVLCSRAGFLSFPKILNDFEVLGFKFESKNPVPIDSLITNLAETAYVSHKAMPYINRPYRNRPAIMDRISRYIDPPEDLPPVTDFTVDLAPFPSHFLPSGRAVFPMSKRKDAIRMMGRDVRPDTVIYATGYKQEFPFFDEADGYPRPSEADIRNVAKTGGEDVGFIGFVRPGVGAIPPIAEMQAFFWISLIKGQIQQPLTPPHYHLLVKETARIKYGVDHSAYMSTLAKDIGAAPGLWELWWKYGTHVLLCYCFGAAFTAFYRLVGPFQTNKVVPVIKTELWDTVTRRGFLGTYPAKDLMSAAAYHPAAPITLQRDIASQPITALSFDPVSDTLWSGTNTGNVTAYYTPQGLRGVRFPVGGSLAVKKLVADESFVRACGLDSEGVGSWGKGGVNKWYHRTPAGGVTTFSNNLSSSKALAVATSSLELVLLNSSTGSVMRQAPLVSTVNHLHFSHSFLVSGSSDGFVRCHDPRTGLRREGGAESAVKAHASEIQGLQTSGNYLYTIGWGLRQSRPVPDPLVKMYDLRTMRPLPPVPFPAGPQFINVLPRRSSSIVVTSNQGLINIVDTSNPTNASEFYQLDSAAYVSSAAVSPTGVYMAFGDSDGVIHLMTAADEGEIIPFNGFESQPVEWANTAEPPPEIEWTDTTPLSSIGLPYYNTPLLSAWTSKFEPLAQYSNAPQKIPPQVLGTMKFNDNIAYATLPRELKGRRNMVTAIPRKDQGQFRSRKSRTAKSERESMEVIYDSNEIPPRYRKVEIEYSKFGVEDFDFGFYNKTEYSGLETHILNSYTNPLVQVMHYIEPIRRLAKSHITTNCPREHCLLCELGFVVRMLEDAKGTNCQASNFCKTVGVLAQSSNAIELVDYGRDSADLDHAHMIQSFHRFLIDHLSSEGNTFPHNPVLLHSPVAGSSPLSTAAAPITQLLGLDGKNIIVCTNCKAVRDKENMTHIIDLIYPRKGLIGESSAGNDFVSIVHASLIRQMSHKATCQTCKQFSTFESRRSVPTRDLPPVLALNANVFNEENLDYWQDNRKQAFLRPRIELRGQNNGADDLQSVTYELRAMVVKVVAKDKRSHLVAIVKIPGDKLGQEYTSPWFLFNDFVVQNITEEEALSFPGKWKVPSILYMERGDLRDTLDYSGLPDTIDTSILSQDTSISIHRDPSVIKHEPLQADELPRPGTLVAIDAEFVQMQQEEMEYRSDGTKKVLRPARLSLARVSVLRGDGSKQGIPFVDDHIHTSEVIVDYLTEFSGIKFGDLDPHTSPYTLTPLKLVYKKLRLLVDRGCIFIGHGLSKDFRIINIFVPPEQVIDTVDLYFLKARQRRLSLRFLSWFVLGETIQTDTHDSIEDARSALMLYKAYHEFEEKGTFDEKLEELYREGRKYSWKPPPLPGAAAAVTPTPTPPAQMPVNPFALMHGNILQSNLMQGPWSAQPVPPNMPPNFFGLPPASQFDHARGGQRGPWTR
ncbi:hypothetical protein EWM64_g1049 [Hericium alpestre]|uniref:PAN2-PAN3 deadenylation complex catalytic subunit PAN2 n=1 Tax=Hericium alpestre TaxID=135208 RepID=A0A4Z0A9F2_9AGAM|nr:hypothetical protein EWM64_g1049 [Hericium alpestre]